MANDDARRDAASRDITTAKKANDRLELMAGDLIRRLRVLQRAGMLHDEGGEYEADFAELLAAVDALEESVNERAAAVSPFGDRRLLEAQGRRIRELEELHARAEARLSEMAVCAATLEEERARIELEHARCMRSPTEEERRQRMTVEAHRAYWQEPCVRCKRPRLDHPRAGTPCPGSEVKSKAEWACLACGGGPVGRKILDDGRVVWFCPSCAERGGSEEAGIRGTGQ